jgi:hypothetical protein
MSGALGLARIGQAAALATHEDVAAGVQLRHPPFAALYVCPPICDGTVPTRAATAHGDSPVPRFHVGGDLLRCSRNMDWLTV